MIAEEKSVSTFALIVDKLRMMDEAELKLAYIKLFEKELTQEWKELVSEMNFGDLTDEKISQKVYESRDQMAPQT